MRRPQLLSSAPGRVVGLILGTISLLTLVGIIAMWPGGGGARTGSGALGDITGAEVTTVSGEQGCREFTGPDCRLVEITLLDGPLKGRTSSFALPGGDQLAANLDPGDRIRVARNRLEGNGPGAADPPIDDPAAQPFAFVDFERRAPLIGLAVLFALLVVGFGRLHGLRSLVGLGLSLVVVVQWLVPAILDGHPPLLAAMTGALAVMLLTIGITHGFGVKSAAAMLGTTGALVLTALLALAAVELAHITGLSSEQSTLLFFGSGRDLSLAGLVLAGMVVGALGVLDDVTISQASTVLALRRANPALEFGRLTKEAMIVGRDHLGATVNTLVLAYAGASLPVLLILANQGTAFGEGVNLEPVASEIVAMLVGSIGLIAAVPLTTALAAGLAVRIPAEALPDAHGHAH